MNQIILITDGCSNVGVSPVIAAAHAKSEGIVVNVIGLIDSSEIGEHGIAEINEIAEAGGGMSRIVNTTELSQTVQMMTRKTVVQTIQQVVGKELQHILGDSKIESLPPEQRSQVVRVMDDLSETAALRVALLIDASASMKPKMQAVKESIYDLQLSIQARTGDSEMAVFHFPASVSGDEAVEMDLSWTRDLANLNRLFYKLNMKGTTPTGPALLKVIQFMAGVSEEESSGGPWNATAYADEQERPHKGKDGMLSDYVV
ncbi:VWA domain-containing protein [Paenibacillus doosanensis]|uniref:von Willebrand factor type A domain protein n=1 Tax=Paenibacillus konkukensis TaxID=2020716 RepID=A0ABY4RQZ0_9BACL|nr:MULTISPECIES: VWA domain-containing protein [Paenibacillus]MCS7463191.1 VWA domain-containing protein [Paenibacillus doosanensis]UQZ84921.1 von Willebrand factor type A domain protein [Paenibacillus konkukensis]